jgi:hypothetical protein
MNVFEQRQQEAVERVRALLDLPPIPGGDVPWSYGEHFDPCEQYKGSVIRPFRVKQY